MTKDEADGYLCIFCQRFIEADEHGIIVHDEGVDHGDAKFDEERTLQ